MTDVPSNWQYPEWSNAYDYITGKGRRVHNWLNYVPVPVREMWDTFTPDQKRELARGYEEVADGEYWN